MVTDGNKRSLYGRTYQINIQRLLENIQTVSNNTGYGRVERKHDAGKREIWRKAGCGELATVARNECAKEIQQWKWKKDERTNTYLEEPVPFFDDAMAMLRYSIEEERKAKPKLNRGVKGGI